MIQTNTRAEALIASGVVDRAIAAIRIDPMCAVMIAKEAQRLNAKRVSMSAGAVGASLSGARELSGT